MTDSARAWHLRGRREDNRLEKIKERRGESAVKRAKYSLQSGGKAACNSHALCR